MRSVLTVTVNVEVFIFEEDGAFFADCPFLDAVSPGTTEEAALKNFREELQFLVEVVHEAGELEALLDFRTSLRRGEHARGDSVTLKRHRVPAEIPAELLTRFTDAAAAFH